MPRPARSLQARDHARGTGRRRTAGTAAKYSNPRHLWLPYAAISVHARAHFSNMSSSVPVATDQKVRGTCRSSRQLERAFASLCGTAGARVAMLGTPRGHLAGGLASACVPHACQNAERTGVICGHSPTVQTGRELHGGRSAPCPRGPDKEEVRGSSPRRPTHESAGHSPLG
jgi:hypothetical protein